MEHIEINKLDTGDDKILRNHIVKNLKKMVQIKKQQS